MPRPPIPARPAEFRYFCPLPGCQYDPVDLDDFRHHLERVHPEVFLSPHAGGNPNLSAQVGERVCSRCGTPFRPNWVGQVTCSQRCQDRLRYWERKAARMAS